MQWQKQLCQKSQACDCTKTSTKDLGPYILVIQQIQIFQIHGDCAWFKDLLQKLRRVAKGSSIT